MHGLLLRSIQAYVRATFGAAVWGRVLHVAGQPPEGFEPMLPYGPAVLDGVIAASATVLERTAEVILEDLGTYLVADSGHVALRRLLRFGGTSFEEFLQSLEEFPDRFRLALPYLDFPQVSVEEQGPGGYRLFCCRSFPALLQVAQGALRAMADDYGALALIEPARDCDGAEPGAALTVQILAATHGEGRRFELVATGGRNGW